MTTQTTFDCYTRTSREVGLDWHVWVFFAHFFRMILRNAGRAARFCENEARKA